MEMAEFAFEKGRKGRTGYEQPLLWMLEEHGQDAGAEEQVLNSLLEERYELDQVLDEGFCREERERLSQSSEDTARISGVSLCGREELTDGMDTYFKCLFPRKGQRWEEKGMTPGDKWKGLSKKWY